VFFLCLLSKILFHAMLGGKASLCNLQWSRYALTFFFYIWKTKHWNVSIYYFIFINKKCTILYKNKNNIFNKYFREYFIDVSTELFKYDYFMIWVKSSLTDKKHNINVVYILNIILLLFIYILI